MSARIIKPMLNGLQVCIVNYFKERNYAFVTPIEEIPNKRTSFDYICVCGRAKRGTFRDISKRNCRWCRDKKAKEILEDIIEEKEYLDSDTGERWVRITGAWISDQGRAKNVYKNDLTVGESNRVYVMGRNRYLSRLVAKAFKIDGYENIDDTANWVVIHIDKNPANNSLNNLRIVSRAERGRMRGVKSHKSFQFKEKCKLTESSFSHLEYKVVPDYPNHKIYANGEVWNGGRFLTFSKQSNTDKYSYINLPGGKSIKVHRLVCFAFHPIEGKVRISDYNDLQVNHKDGNPANNSADNLEWCTRSDNMKHSYTTGLNKKVAPVYMYEKIIDTETNIASKGKLLSEFPSIAQASRDTDISEHEIRSISKGIRKSGKYIWEYVDLDAHKKNSIKFSWKPQPELKADDKADNKSEDSEFDDAYDDAFNNYHSDSDSDSSNESIDRSDGPPINGEDPKVLFTPPKLPRKFRPLKKVTSALDADNSNRT